MDACAGIPFVAILGVLIFVLAIPQVGRRSPCCCP
jgi:hypothetical protein